MICILILIWHDGELRCNRIRTYPILINGRINSARSLWSTCVPQTASLSEIKSAFRVQAKKTHPDLNPEDPEAANRFIKVTQAYAVLANTESRKEYDFILKAKGKGFSYSETKVDLDSDHLTADQIQNAINVFYWQANFAKSEALEMLQEGLFWFGGGLAVSSFSYVLAVSLDWDSYYVMGGAVLIGAWKAVKGLYYYLKTKFMFQRVESELWDKIA